jgi:anti-sigma factor RsiW
MNDTLKRLLGPDGPEIGCDECFERLDEYVDAELEGGRPTADAAIPGMAEHLEGCPACAEDHRSLRELVARDDA